MKRAAWHITRTDACLTLSRRRGATFDVSAQTRFAFEAGPLARGRLAQQIRQDLWRELQALRGFCPIIEVHADEAGLVVTAGGELTAKPFPKTKVQTQIEALLADPKKRARWRRGAAVKGRVDAP